jgi:hypothetical protein
MKKGFKNILGENPQAHIICDEMPVGINGLPTKDLKELSKKIPGANIIKPFSYVI